MSDFVPTKKQATDLANRKAVWSFTFCSVHKDPKKAGNYCCQILDMNTGRVLSEEYDRSTEAAFNAAYEAMPTYVADESPETVEALRAKIAELEAQVKAPPSVTRKASNAAAVA